MSGKYIFYSIGVVVVAAAIVAAGYMVRSTQAGGSSVLVSNPDKYYSVFLKNNQVYFGKIGKTDSQYTQLTGIYYLNLADPIQPKKDGVANGTKAEGPKFTLIKLGRELHDPIDEMIIRNDEISFVEQLQDDSRVIQAIDKAKTESVQN